MTSLSRGRPRQRLTGETALHKVTGSLCSVPPAPARGTKRPLTSRGRRVTEAGKRIRFLKAHLRPPSSNQKWPCCNLGNAKRKLQRQLRRSSAWFWQPSNGNGAFPGGIKRSRGPCAKAALGGRGGVRPDRSLTSQMRELN